MKKQERRRQYGYMFTTKDGIVFYKIHFHKIANGPGHVQIDIDYCNPKRFMFFHHQSQSK